ncbi:hypothetical protein ACFSCV_17020 [Methylopila henanensis]|uniref:Uncharacterized protein n=1 Tax=Methylopila henanensis TaxID=873516 RepID=A0ABW4KDB0_9HYPH
MTSLKRPDRALILGAVMGRIVWRASRRADAGQAMPDVRDLEIAKGDARRDG